MNNFFSRLFRKCGHITQPGGMDRAFVSDHTRFIEHFLEEHPEVVAEQHTGWRIYWDKKVNLAAQKAAEEDAAPDDGYGFRSMQHSDRKSLH